MIKSRIALFIGIILISIYPVFVKFTGGLAGISAFYRVLIPALCLFPVLFINRKNIPKGKSLIGTLLCGVLFGLDIYCWNLAIEGSSATQATLLTNLAPIFVGVIAFLFLPNKPKRNFWIGSAIAIFGMIIFIGWRVFADFSFDLPFLLGISSGIIYSVYIVLSKMVLERVQVLPYMAINSISASTALGLVNYFNGKPFIGFATREWVFFILGGLVCQLLAWALISYATKYMRVTRVSLSLLSQTVFAAIFASIFVSEVISPQMIIGGLIILVGIGITFIEKQFKLK
ncbi:DMT family transporter [Weeksellaceae bacterium TAE3-ERU29]|nr:DMT family transporter [Weeksellaceae bacterium TAE3-ERU29]